MAGRPTTFSTYGKIEIRYKSCRIFIYQDSLWKNTSVTTATLSPIQVMYPLLIHILDIVFTSSLVNNTKTICIFCQEIGGLPLGKLDILLRKFEYFLEKELVCISNKREWVHLRAIIIYLLQANTAAWQWTCCSSGNSPTTCWPFTSLVVCWSLSLGSASGWILTRFQPASLWASPRCWPCRRKRLLSTILCPLWPTRRPSMFGQG